MTSDPDAAEAMDDIVRMAERAELVLPCLPTGPDQQEMLENILAKGRLDPRRPRRLILGLAISGVAVVLVLGAVLVAHGGSDGDHRATPREATRSPSTSGDRQLGPLADIPKTPAEWLASQVGGDIVVARRTGVFVYDGAVSREWGGQAMGRAQMIVLTSLGGRLHMGDVFTAVSPIVRRGAGWDSVELELGSSYLLFPDSFGAPRYVVSGDIYRRTVKDTYELLTRTGSNLKAQPRTVSLKSFRFLIAETWIARMLKAFQAF